MVRDHFLSRVIGVSWPELGLGVASLILCAGQCLLSELRIGCCVFDPCAGPIYCTPIHIMIYRCKIDNV